MNAHVLPTQLKFSPTPVGEELNVAFLSVVISQTLVHVLVPTASLLCMRLSHDTDVRGSVYDHATPVVADYLRCKGACLPTVTFVSLFFVSTNLQYSPYSRHR